jgi:hypothetical protein
MIIQYFGGSGAVGARLCHQRVAKNDMIEWLLMNQISNPKPLRR